MPRKLTSRRARAMAAARKTRRGGRPRVMRECPRCQLSLSAREMLGHRCSI
jgi:hypothetical protein